MSHDSHSRTGFLAAHARYIWALLGLCHVPAVVAAWQTLLAGDMDPTRIFGCLWLTGAMGFFALKFRGVRCLEFATDRRSIATLAVAIVLMHADAIGTRLNFAPVPKDVPLAASTLLLTGLRRVQLAIKSVLQSPWGSIRRPMKLSPAFESACCVAFLPNWLIADSRVRIPRAPPR